MTRRILATTLSAFAIVSAGASAGPAFEAALGGDNEVPPVVTTTTGSARVEFSDDLTAAKFALEVLGGTRVTQAHIHCAPAGANGPVVVFLVGFHDRGWDVDGPWIDNASVTDANVVPQDGMGVCPNAIATIADLAAAAADGNLYVNVHSIANPPGVVRGQLAEADDGEGEEPKVEVCHAPPGNPANAHTILVDPSAVAAHLDHGDWLGPCDGPQPEPSRKGSRKH